MAFNTLEPTAQILWTPTQRPGVTSITRRVGVACAFCRLRKVKCNRLDDQPCTNCIFENVQCLLLPKQRRHRKARNSIRTPGQEVPQTTAPDLATSNEWPTNPLAVQTQLSPPPVFDSPIQQPLEPETTSEDSAPADCDIQSNQDFDSDINWRDAAVEAVPLRPPNRSISPSLNPPSLRGGREFLTFSVPSFLKPPPSCLGEQDLDYLARKGALYVPEPELRDALIESYVYYIHPCYPILDLDTLEDAMLDNSNNPFSLSVFQAIMFAGSSWVDVTLLRKLGYLSRWAARQAFYSRARLLYDTDYEQDPICQLQTLVLLSLWWKGPNQPKDGWHWLGLAISLARTMGLHQDATNKHLDPKSSALRRRIWWSCTVRDTFASFSSNRVPRISDVDFVVAPLTLHDFEWHEYSEGARRGIGKQSMDVQKQLAAICIQTTAICRIITRVLLAAYNETSTGDIDILYFNSTPDQGRLHIEPKKLRNIEAEFGAWKTGLPPDVVFTSPGSRPCLRHEQAPLVHRALLSILYHTGLIMIHRQRNAGSFPDETPRDLVRSAARQVNKIAMDMYAVDLMKDLPPTVISLLFPASLSHILDMKSRDRFLRREGVQRLEECKQALRELTDGHLAAEWAVNLLKYVETRVNAETPAMKALSTAVDAQTHPWHEEKTVSRGQNTPGQRQDYGEALMSAQDPPPATLLGSSERTSTSTSTSYMQSTSFMPNFGDSTGTDDPGNWSNFPNVWFGFPEAQWDVPSMARLEHDTMEFGEGSFRG